MKIHDLSTQHIFPSKRCTIYECIPELVVTVPSGCSTIVKKIKLVLWGTDGRLPLSDLDLGSGHTAYRRASLIDLYLRTKFH